MNFKVEHFKLSLRSAKKLILECLFKGIVSLSKVGIFLDIRRMLYTTCSSFLEQLNITFVMELPKTRTRVGWQVLVPGKLAFWPEY